MCDNVLAAKEIEPSEVDLRHRARGTKHGQGVRAMVERPDLGVKERLG